MSELKALLGEKVYGKNGQEVSVDTLADCKMIGIYFSAHWCPPCRGFTPMLAECYKKIKAAGKKFEVIFVSSDRDQKSFDEYYETMPWLTIGLTSDKKSSLSQEYSVSGIPCLVLLDNTGKLITKEGRNKVMNDQEGASFPWTA